MHFQSQNINKFFFKTNCKTIIQIKDLKSASFMKKNLMKKKFNRRNSVLTVNLHSFN